MDSVRVSPVAFKGIYKISGNPEVLDEILWFMQKQSKRKQELDMDFLDIRLKKKSPSATEKVLRYTRTSEIDEKERLAIINDHILDLVSIRNRTMKPFAQRENENIDLFATGADKSTIEKKVREMVEASLELYRRRLSFLEKTKLLIDNLTLATDNMRKGKPIGNINPLVVKNSLDPLDLDTLPILPAERFFEGIQRGAFDILSGNLAIA